MSEPAPPRVHGRNQLVPHLVGRQCLNLSLSSSGGQTDCRDHGGVRRPAIAMDGGKQCFDLLTGQVGRFLALSLAFGLERLTEEFALRARAA
ncbi:hypothetical protein D3C85_1511280 [compost metagenome]